MTAWTPRCVRLASAKAEEIVALLKGALEQHEVQRVQARVRRHRQGAAAPAPDPSAQAPMLVDTAGGEGNASGRELASELGIDLSDDDEVMGSSSSSGDSEPSSSSGEDEDAGLASGVGRKTGAPGKKAVDVPQILAKGWFISLWKNNSISVRQVSFTLHTVTIPSSQLQVAELPPSKCHARPPLRRLLQQIRHQHGLGAR